MQAPSASVIRAALDTSAEHRLSVRILFVLIRVFRPWLQPQGSEHATRAEQRGTT